VGVRVLYHFPTSVFSRRARLALAHKGLEFELRDARADEKLHAEAKKLSAQATMPVLVDDGRAVGDSTAIAFYLDLAYPDRPRLFPTGIEAAHAAISIVSLVDVAMNTLVELGTRFYSLRGDPGWEKTKAERIGRAQAAIDAVAALASKPHLVGDAWTVADIWAFSATRWVAGMPARAPSAPLVAQILTLGFRLPEPLVAWATQHDARFDARAVYE
jgi:glutathione S-transferase